MNPWIENLISRQNKGEQLDFLFFWGHRPKADGSVSKSCFSQWYNQGFTQNDEYFRTAEHWMMAAKAALFGDEQVRKAILATRTPLEAKKLGRKVRDFDQERWDEAKFDLVVEGNLLKFSQNQKFEDFLMSTSGKVLVEAAPDDFIWGIGMVADDPRAPHPEQWAGGNLLGFALMEVRDRLQS